MRKLFSKFDIYFIELINNKIKNKYFDKFMFRVTDLGGAIFSTLFALVLILFGKGNIRFIGLEALAAMGFSQIIVQAGKRSLGRKRPYDTFSHLNTFGIVLKDYSFPSGHTTASFTIATTLALNISGAWLLVYILATIIGISRIYLAVHYPTDVLAGIIVGVGSSLIVHKYLLAYIRLFASAIGMSY